MFGAVCGQDTRTPIRKASISDRYAIYPLSACVTQTSALCTRIFYILKQLKLTNYLFVFNCKIKIYFLTIKRGTIAWILNVHKCCPFFILRTLWIWVLYRKKRASCQREVSPKNQQPRMCTANSRWKHFPSNDGTVVPAYRVNSRVLQFPSPKMRAWPVLSGRNLYMS